MDYRKVSSERLYDVFQKVTLPVLELIEKYATLNEADVKPVLLDTVERMYHLQGGTLCEWLENATTVPKDEHPRYVEGKGIYVPVIGKYLAMKDIFDGEKVTWDDAVRVAVPSRDEWYIILYYKDEINRLLRENGGEELDKWYWTSTESFEDIAWSVSASNGNVINYNKIYQNSVRAWVTTKAVGMTQENKELLLKELCARLPYGVKAQVVGWDEEKKEEISIPLKVYSVNTDGYVYFEINDYGVDYLPVDECRLYLRPMSSMTKEEKYLYRHMLGATINSEGESIMFVYVEEFPTVMDWLNEYHFDYRDLIDRGLALEAPEGVYAQT